MCTGGIERALINVLKSIDYNKYAVTLLLEKKEGELLNEVPSSVLIKEYKVNSNKNIVIRKIMNRFKLIYFIICNLNKYDFSVSFHTSSIPMGILSRYLSKNNYLWVHADYEAFYNR